MAGVNETIDLLFTADAAYLKHIAVTLISLYINDPGYKYSIHIITKASGSDDADMLRRLCVRIGYSCFWYSQEEGVFENAPTTDRYPADMYQRLLAGKVLPKELDKVIYLDGDTLIINPLHPLWEYEMNGKIFLAATHITEGQGMESLNQIRLGTSGRYYNTGLIVMDLKKMREQVRVEDISRYLAGNRMPLLLPDQDVFNALYGEQIDVIPDSIWNYDARKYTKYLTGSGGEYNERWVMENTAVLHYCGRSKPWNPYYPYRFGHIYLHYESICRRLLEQK